MGGQARRGCVSVCVWYEKQLVSAKVAQLVLATNRTPAVSQRLS